MPCSAFVLVIGYGRCNDYRVDRRDVEPCNGLYKDLCVSLEREGRIIKTWGTGSRKPQDNSRIQLADRS